MMNRSDLQTYLHVIPWDLSYPGGVSEVVRNLLIQTDKAGEYIPRLLISDWSTISNREYSADSRWLTLNYRLRPIPSGRIYNLRILLMWSRFIFEWMKLASWLFHHKVSHVALHYFLPAYYGFFLLKRLGIIKAKLIPVFHGTDLKNLSKTCDPEYIEKMLSEASTIVVVSHSQEIEFKKIFPSLSRKVLVINNGVDTAVQDKNRQEPRLNDRYNILSVGTFDENKGHEGLLEAFATISSRYSDWDLVMIGRTGPTLDYLIKRIQEFNLTERVIIYENIPHEGIDQYYRNADLFVINSNSEAFPLVVLEAGYYGLPVIATSVGGIPEIITDSSLGSLVPPGDIASLVNAITLLIDKPDMRAILGHNLKTLVNEKYSWRNSYLKYAAI